jgi:pimeloyl-ACP methyl ester carboxylesterase
VHQGFNVVFLSYQGFDTNDGYADLASLCDDVGTFHRFCQERFPGQPIALIGESLSAGVFFCFASRHPEVACGVFDSVVDLKRVAFTKINDSWPLFVAYPITGPVALMISAGVPGELSAQKALARRSLVPALFIHHPEDPVTPYRGACHIYENYAGPKEFIRLETENADLHMAGQTKPEVQAQVLSFLRRHLHADESNPPD